MNPEDLTFMLNQYLSEMFNIAMKYGGTIDKFIGDAIMVFFGDPHSLGEDKDAIQCVSMAMEMQEATKNLTKKIQNRWI